jgi:hypothetical protein
MVTVTDVAPTIIAPSDVSVPVNALGGANVVLGSPVIGSIAYSGLTATNDAPTLFPIGTTTVTWTVVDPSGLTASATQMVTVTDVAPTIIAPSDVGVLANTLGGANGFSLGTPVVGSIAYADSSLVITNNAPVSGLFPLGSTTVTWTVTDGSSLFATATQIVTVTDVAPVVTITAPTNGAVMNSGSFSVSGTASDANGLQWVDVSVDGGSWVDPAGMTSWSYSVSGLADGSHIIYARAEDNAGSFGESSVTITVQTQFTLTVTQTANGGITPGTTNVNYGASQAFTITPNTGYSLASITADGSSVPVTSPSGQTISFTDVQAGHTLTATYAPSNGYLVVRGENNVIYYRIYNSTTASWNAWNNLPDGETMDSPAAAVVGNQLQIVVRGMNNDQIWYSSVSLTDGTFSGWTLLDGATPSAPTLTANSTTLCLVVRGENNIIYYRFYTVGTQTWGNWIAVPTGATVDSPAATLIGDNLQIVVRGMNNDQIWYSSVSLTDGTFSGWTLLDGATPSAPTLTANSTTLGLVVRGENNVIYYRFYTIATQTWSSWTAIPTGSTMDSPAATIIGNSLQIVVRGISNDQIWHCTLDLSTYTWTSWTLQDIGAIPSAPRLTS